MVTRALPAAAERVNEYAPYAPTSIKNEAVIRFVGWFAQADFATIRSETIGPRSVEYNMNHANALQDLRGNAIAESLEAPARRSDLMRLPWQKAEKRESGGDFSDAVVRLIESQAAGSAADASSTAAVEAASGALSRAFASASVEAESWAVAAVTPGFLAQVGRDLVRPGEEPSRHSGRPHGRRDFDPVQLVALGRARMIPRPGRSGQPPTARVHRPPGTCPPMALSS